MCFEVSKGGAGMQRALAICSKQRAPPFEGATILILSDRPIDKEYAPIPSLLATSGLHHYLVREACAPKQP